MSPSTERKKYLDFEFPGGPVVKNPPAKAEDAGLIPGPGNPTCHRAAKPVLHNKGGPRSEKLMPRN